MAIGVYLITIVMVTGECVRDYHSVGRPDLKLGLAGNYHKSYTRL